MLASLISSLPIFHRRLTGAFCEGPGEIIRVLVSENRGDLLDGEGGGVEILAGGPDDDDDSDGLSNFEEYAFGLDPGDSGSVRAVTMVALKTTGAFTYTRRKTSLSGLGYKVWTSSDLSGWIEDTAASQTASPIPGTDNELVEVIVSPERLGSDRLFVRIAVLSS